MASFARAFQEVSDFKIESCACRRSFFHFSLQIAKCSMFRHGVADWHLGICLPPEEMTRNNAKIIPEYTMLDDLLLFKVVLWGSMINLAEKRRSRSSILIGNCLRSTNAMFLFFMICSSYVSIYIFWWAKLCCPSGCSFPKPKQTQNLFATRLYSSQPS